MYETVKNAGETLGKPYCVAEARAKPFKVLPCLKRQYNSNKENNLWSKSYNILWFARAKYQKFEIWDLRMCLKIIITRLGTKCWRAKTFLVPPGVKNLNSQNEEKAIGFTGRVLWILCCHKPNWEARWLCFRKDRESLCWCLVIKNCKI